MKRSFKNIVTQYRQETKASIATIFGVTAPILLLGVGVAFDTNQITNMKGQSQLMADVIGLNASIYVKNNEGPPTNNDQGFLHNQWYNASDVDLDFGQGKGDTNTTRFKITYDDVNEKAVVTVESTMEPIFMSGFGTSEVNFTTLSTVNYAKKERSNPASIFFVVDNSGSMAFDDMPLENFWSSSPVGAKPRITGMKTALKEFSQHLSKIIVGDDTDSDKQYLRMGLTAYNTNIINARTITPKWGTVSEHQIDKMEADGGTVPTAALAKVQSWMSGEDKKHEAKNGNDDPLKYVILMADGANSYANSDAQALSVCTSIKASGVEIFTIGFALEPGHFYTGTWGQKYNRLTYYISPSVKEKAQSFLENCASSPNHFLLADDANALKTAFDKIGAEIIEDAVRISS